MYIHSFCSISPAGVITQDSSSENLQTIKEEKSVCIEPDYKDLIPAMQLRRMTKPVRTGVAAAKLCLEKLSNPAPDAIHVGTAYGMLQDSENFLQKIIEQDEQMLTPTAFIQSTHNTVAGQIALSLGCYAHNMTYVHKAHSFESAMLDAELMLEEHPKCNVLVGAVDECTSTSFNILKRFGVYDQEHFAGEGSNFFVLSNTEGTHAIAQLTAFEMFVSNNLEDTDSRINAFLENNNKEIKSTDLVLSGTENLVVSSYFSKNEVIYYKQYCGEFPTSSSFALALALLKIKEQKTERCWIVNQFGKHGSLWLIEKNKPV